MMDITATSDIVLLDQYHKAQKKLNDKQRDYCLAITDDGRNPCEAAEHAGYQREYGYVLLKNPDVRQVVALRREMKRRESGIELSWVLTQYREVYDNAMSIMELTTAKAALDSLVKVCGFEPDKKLDIVVNTPRTINPNDIAQLAILNALIEESEDGIIEGAVAREVEGATGAAQ